MLTLIQFRFQASEDNRLTGALGGIYGNANDLALDIVMAFPFCVLFLVRTQNILKKVAWFVAIALLGYALLLTYSRGAVLALVVSGAVLLWEFGIKGKRYGLIAAAGLMALCLVGVLGPKGYMNRVISIVHPSSDAGDKGSWEARKALLIQSLSITAHYPIFGVGCGNFVVVSGDWHVAHNSYTELGADGGVFVLLLFVLILRRSVVNLREVESLAPKQPDLQLFRGAFRVSLVAFLVGAFFVSASYHFFAYFLVAFSGALHHIATVEKERLDSGELPVTEQHSGLKGAMMGGVIGARAGQFTESLEYAPRAKR